MCDDRAAVSVRSVVEAVLKSHPLQAGEGFYAGTIVCTVCHVCVLDPTQHLLGALTEALDPDSMPLVATETPERHEPRESYTDWLGTAS